MPLPPEQRRPEPDTDPATVTGLIYRILTHWRTMLGAVIAALVIAAILLLTHRLLGPISIHIGPISIQPTTTGDALPPGAP